MEGVVDKVKRETALFLRDLSVMSGKASRKTRHDDEVKRFYARIYLLAGGGRVNKEIGQQSIVSTPSNSTIWRTIREHRVDFKTDVVCKENVCWALKELAKQVKFANKQDFDHEVQMSVDELAILIGATKANRFIYGLPW